jgi:hypothetical protein
LLITIKLGHEASNTARWRDVRYAPPMNDIHPLASVAAVKIETD